MTPAARLALVGVATLALLGVVALASRGGIGGGGTAPKPPASLLDYGFSIFIVLYFVSIPFTIWLYFTHGRAVRAGGSAPRGRGLLTNIAIFVAFVAAALAIIQVRRSHGTQPTIQFPKPVALGEQPKKAADEERAPDFQWSVVAGLGVLVAAGVGWYVVQRCRRAARPARLGLSAELAVALDDAIDDVRAETDPRRAVIKAYARMEAVLGAHGLPRDPAEAPYEYLARALDAVDASAGSVERLTDLFERAKFSQHEIPASMRDDAIEALTAVRDELRGAD